MNNKENSDQHEIAVDAMNTTVLNGTIEKETPSTENKKSGVWRKITVTLTILAATISMTFSWQKKEKKEPVPAQQEVMQTEQPVMTDTLK